MKGITIYETPLWGDEENVVYLQSLADASYTLKQVGSDDITCHLEGTAKDPVVKAKCNKDDEYDFEMGALIALMKKCGVRKVADACNEAFPHETSGSIYAENKQYRKIIKWLEEENEKLKLDCEKLQHGYNADMIFCGGRGNGKQHKALIELFKKIDQKKVDAAYKEAYNTTLPVWQKEFIKEAYNITQDEKEKRNKEKLNRIYGAQSLGKLGKFYSIDEFGMPKKLSKREDMWTNIFKSHKENDVIIEVKKEDVNAFLHEIENKIPEITWYSGVKIFERKIIIKDIYEELKRCDKICFRLQKENKLTYSSDPHIYPYREYEHIEYLPPMRWDLFEKGRRIVRVTSDNLDSFLNECEKNYDVVGSKGFKYFIKNKIANNHGFIIISKYLYDNKPTLHFMTPEDLVRNQIEFPITYDAKKIVDWEDVR